MKHFYYVHLNIKSELKNGESMMLSIWEVHASNKDPAVTAVDTWTQRSLGSDKRPRKLKNWHKIFYLSVLSIVMRESDLLIWSMITLDKQNCKTKKTMGD